MKKQLLFLIMMMPLVVSAYDIKVPNADGVTIYYNYINDGKELEVTYNDNQKYTGDIVIPDEAAFMNRTRKVTSIGNYTFSGTDITSITIPKTVTRIGTGAFSGVDLSTVISLIENPFTINGVFTQNTLYNATLYVPKGTINKYKATWAWNNFLFIEEITTNVPKTSARPVLVKTDNGFITVEGIDDRTNVSIYTTDGKQAGSAISQNNTATIATSIQPGSIAIVKIGDMSVKVVMK